VPVGTRPVERIRKVPDAASIMVPAGSAGAHTGLPLAGSSSIVYWADERELGTLRQTRGSLVGVVPFQRWFTAFGAGTPVHFAQ
jgi:hypothetical protein